MRTYITLVFLVILAGCQNTPSEGRNTSNESEYILTHEFENDVYFTLGFSNIPSFWDLNLTKKYVTAIGRNCTPLYKDIDYKEIFEVREGDREGILKVRYSNKILTPKKDLSEDEIGCGIEPFHERSVFLITEIELSPNSNEYILYNKSGHEVKISIAK